MSQWLGDFVSLEKENFDEGVFVDVTRFGTLPLEIMRIEAVFLVHEVFNPFFDDLIGHH